MKILAIETSCDDTGVAIIEIKGQKKPCFTILSNIVSSQVEIHRKWGGVYPSLAKREHQKNLIPTLKEALEKAEMLKIINYQLSIINKNPKSKITNPKKIQNLKLQTLNEILTREKTLCEEIVKFLEKYETGGDW